MPAFFLRYTYDKNSKTTYNWDAERNMLTEMQYNHGQSGSSGNGNSGNNGNGNNGNGEVPPGQNVDKNGNITNNGGNTPPGLNRRNKENRIRTTTRISRRNRTIQDPRTRVIPVQTRHSREPISTPTIT